MNTSRELSHHKPRGNTLAYFITINLGYCCEYFFFTRYTNTALIAARLGVNRTAVNRHKRELQPCEQKPNCMKCYLKETPCVTTQNEKS